MKRLLAILLLAIFAFSCGKEKTEEYATYSFSAGICPDTKAHADDGKGDHVNRCIMEVYYENTLCNRLVSPVIDKSASFEARLALHRTYRVVFWADCAGPSLSDLYYSSSPLTSISYLQTYRGSNDAMDAFCYSGAYTTDDVEPICHVELSRPFAQLNTSDSDYTGTGVTVSFSVPLLYNARDDLIGPPVSVSYTNDGLYCHDPKILSMDYIFAPETKSAINLTIDGTTYTDIPIQRNIRTNVTFEH